MKLYVFLEFKRFVEIRIKAYELAAHREVIDGQITGFNQHYTLRKEIGR